MKIVLVTTIERRTEGNEEQESLLGLTEVGLKHWLKLDKNENGQNLY